MRQPQALVLLETSGNQAYIFSTNKLKQQIGASELTYRAGTRWLAEALGVEEGAADSPPAWRERLHACRGQLAPGVEVVIATSGKALLLCERQEQARAIIREITTRALAQAPGLQVCGAAVELTGQGRAAAREAMRAVHARFNAHRQTLTLQRLRHPRLPLVEACRTSGLPATAIEDGEPIGAESLAKSRAAPEWFARLKRLRDHHKENIRFAFSLDDLEKVFAQDFVGVIHADGNGLGQIVLAFDKWLDTGEDYFATLRQFSLELEEATEGAFFDACTAAQTLWPQASSQNDKAGRYLPILPLILGGDDLVAAVGGELAFPFLVEFLRAFERRTAEQRTLARIAEKALGAPRLGISAGLALVKPHFPFALAIELTDALMASAKTIKREVSRAWTPYPCSSFDAHVLLDTSGGDLDAIRARRRGPGGERLWGGPYVVTPLDALAGADEPARQWAERHHVGRLYAMIAAIHAKDSEGRPVLPRSQLHALREALSQGRQPADELWRLLRKRYATAAALAMEADSVFEDEGAQARTLFLDALTFSAFRPAAEAERSAVAGRWA